MIKCGVCGSENEAAALFCGVCGSPLPRQEAPPPTEAVTPVPPVTPPGTGQPEAADIVVPGQNRARRDLGIGGETGLGSQGVGSKTEPTAVTPNPEPESSGPTVVCQVCGTINDATRTYCRKCANELKPAAAPPPPPPDPAPARKLSPVAIGLGAAAAVVAIALIGVLVLGGGGVTPSAAPSQSAILPTLPPVASELPTDAPATEPPFTEGDPTGTIAFARCDGAGTGSCRIFLIDVENPSDIDPVTVLSAGTATDPALSSDGTHLLYSQPGGLRLLEIGSDDRINQSTTAGDLNAYWSPDDADIVFSGRRTRDPGSDDEDREIRFDGAANGEVRDSEPLTQNDIEDHDPIITPDGLSVIWVQGSGDDRELKIMSLDPEDEEEDDLTSDEFNDVDPAISPDGRTLAFASTRSSGDGTFDLFLLDIESKVITPLPPIDGDEHDPWWSPGGRYLVYSGGTDEDRDLWILDLSDNSVDQLTSTGDRDLTPSWR